MGRNEKPIKGIWEWGRREVWTLESTKTGNLPWWRGPLSFPSAWTQYVLLRPLQAPLHSSAKAVQQTELTAATRLRTVALAAMSPRRTELPHIIWELMQRWFFYGEEGTFELGLGVIYDFQQICCCLEVLSRLDRAKGRNCAHMFSCVREVRVRPSNTTGGRMMNLLWTDICNVPANRPRDNITVI